MSSSSNLVYLDWMIGGRVALDELWQFERYIFTPLFNSPFTTAIILHVLLHLDQNLAVFIYEVAIAAHIQGMFYSFPDQD